MRVHLLAHPNSQTTADYELCGFSVCTRRFARILKMLGYTVFLYASEDNDAPCDELVTVITKAEQMALLKGHPYQSAQMESDCYPLWKTSNDRTIVEIGRRKHPRDLICTLGGRAQVGVSDAHKDLLSVEYSIGYPYSCLPYRVFQSVAWQHWTYGQEQREDGPFFDAAIPYFFDPTAYPFETQKDHYVVYVGRLTGRKGLSVACEAAQKAGVPLKVIGHGDTSLVTHGAEYLGALSTPERNRIVSKAQAVLCPTLYIECFGAVSPEAQLCGTPVITTDCGGFTETVEDGVSGFRCHYLGEFVEAIHRAKTLDGLKIRARAERLYSLDTIAPQYQQYFDRLALLWHEGWNTMVAVSSLTTAPAPFKVCKILFSTNRPEYLARTLAAQRLVDWSGCSVDGIFVDDFPMGRDDNAMRQMATDAGYQEIILHDRNLSVGATWREVWDRIADRDYDYIWHQEDDVEVLEPVKVTDLIRVLQETPRASQVVLKRQAWYPHETPPTAKDDDVLVAGFRGEFTKAGQYFSTMASLYPMARVRFDYRKWYQEHYPTDLRLQRANVNEAIVGKALLEGPGLTSLHLKNATGGNLVSHIGQYTVGRRVVEGEPGFESFAMFDPERRYDSVTGQPYHPSGQRTSSTTRTAFLVTSCIETSTQPFNEVACRSAFTAEERLWQTVGTIACLDVMCGPHDRIFLADGSPSWTRLAMFRAEDNVRPIWVKEAYPDVFEDMQAHPSKSYADTRVTLAMAQDRSLGLRDFDVCVKVSGRYLLDHHFSQNRPADRSKFYFKRPNTWEWMPHWSFPLVDRRTVQGDNLLRQYCTALFAWGADRHDLMVSVLQQVAALSLTPPVGHYYMEMLMYFVTRGVPVEDILETDWMISGLDGANRMWRRF
jgi:glycosyltransferase involved in cell wall biosynthesis